MEPLKLFSTSGCSGFPVESPSKDLSGVTRAYITKMCLGPAAQPGHRIEQCHFTQGLFAHSLPGNDTKMLEPYNFPMVVVGSHRGNHFKPNFRLYSSLTVREGSLLAW